MRRSLFIILATVGLSLAAILLVLEAGALGLAQSSSPTVEAATASPSQSPAPIVVVTVTSNIQTHMGLEAPWDLDGVPRVSSGNFDLVVDAVIIDHDQLTLVCSVVGLLTGQSLDAKSFALENRYYDGSSIPDQSRISVTPLAKFDGLQLVGVTFLYREVVANQLTLIVTPPKSDGSVVQPLKVPIAHSYAQADKSPAAQAFLYSLGWLDQGAYRVIYNGYGRYTGEPRQLFIGPGMTETEVVAYRATQAALPTWTPEPPSTAVAATKASGDLSNGMTVRQDGTLRIENTSTGQVNFLYFVYYTDDATGVSYINAGILPN